jgi:hypothetical protein
LRSVAHTTSEIETFDVDVDEEGCGIAVGSWCKVDTVVGTSRMWGAKQGTVS